MVQDLADYLRFGISRPPSKIGLKIHPEEVLAHKLNVSIRNVRKAIANLESDGVLIRQRGRGTFVRKVPQVTGKQCVDSDGKPVFPFTLPIEQLFPEVEKKGRYVCRNFIDSKMPNSSLSISMWIDVSRLSATWRLVLSGVINSAEGLGQENCWRGFYYFSGRMD